MHPILPLFPIFPSPYSFFRTKQHHFSISFMTFTIYSSDFSTLERVYFGYILTIIGPKLESKETLFSFYGIHLLVIWDRVPLPSPLSIMSVNKNTSPPFLSSVVRLNAVSNLLTQVFLSLLVHRRVNLVFSS